MKRTKSRKQRNVTGRAIQRIRKEANPKITQEDMVGRLAAQGLPFQQSSIAKIEAGERWVKDFELAAIAKALRVPVQSLFGGK
jgi:transcriptional regulator with XRE-family HTH domain